MIYSFEAPPGLDISACVPRARWCWWTDGSCPAGQIKRVVGGNHTRAGGTKQVIRVSSCVPR
jgi:hypothetical protein